jgi:hypothetical protein
MIIKARGFCEKTISQLAKKDEAISQNQFDDTVEKVDLFDGLLLLIMIQHFPTNFSTKFMTSQKNCDKIFGINVFLFLLEFH